MNAPPGKHPVDRAALCRLRPTGGASSRELDLWHRDRNAVLVDFVALADMPRTVLSGAAAPALLPTGLSAAPNSPTQVRIRRSAHAIAIGTVLGLLAIPGSPRIRGCVHQGEVEADPSSNTPISN
ncbi:hypothetical protein OG871_27425 [Kitasatospora sp. NBC_00374]|uniref:hypothetical protein n=1 Tax=Kitasatospora sp. NBC_00374 TaxID=2975964 RepID=UPI0030E16AD0